MRGGLGIALSQDRIHFTDARAEPLMLTEPGDWSRHNGYELTGYHDLIDAKTGLNLLGDHWLMAYMYIKPKEGFDKRYLVLRPVDVWPSRKAGEPASGVMPAHCRPSRPRLDHRTAAGKLEHLPPGRAVGLSDDGAGCGAQDSRARRVRQQIGRDQFKCWAGTLV